jgi:hypothetical protein
VTGQSDSIESLVAKFRSSSVNPQLFSVGSILDANPYLGRYAASNVLLPADMIVMIPDQRVAWDRVKPNPPDRAWWRPILESGDYKDFRKVTTWDDGSRCIVIDYHIWKWVDRGFVESLATEGESLRAQLRTKYQKLWSTF